MEKKSEFKIFENEEHMPLNPGVLNIGENLMRAINSNTKYTAEVAMNWNQTVSTPKWDDLIHTAKMVHSTTTPEQQAQIDEFFSNPDFAALVLEVLLNRKYDERQHESLKHAVKQAKVRLDVAQADLESAIIELAAYEVEHEDEVNG